MPLGLDPEGKRHGIVTALSKIRTHSFPDRSTSLERRFLGRDRPNADFGAKLACILKKNLCPLAFFPGLWVRGRTLPRRQRDVKPTGSDRDLLRCSLLSRCPG